MTNFIHFPSRYDENTVNAALSSLPNFIGASVTDDGTRVFFDGEAPDPGSLDSLMGSVQTEDQAKLRMWRFAKPLDDFTSVDYDIALSIRLAPKNTFVKGVLVKRELCAFSTLDSFGREVFGDVIVAEDVNYTRDPAGFALWRDTTISWFCEDGRVHPTKKVLRKTYGPGERIREASRRYANVVSSIKTVMIGAMFMAGMERGVAIREAQLLASEYGAEIGSFLEAGHAEPLKNKLAVDARSWLEIPLAPGVTLRMYLLNELTM